MNHQEWSTCKPLTWQAQYPSPGKHSHKQGIHDVYHRILGIGKLLLRTCLATLQGPQGMRAIRTFGPGSLSNVRVIPLAAHTVFWFEVNAAKAVEQIQPIFIASLAGHVECTQPDMPAWALSSKPLFPQEALRRSKRPYLEEDSSQGSLNHLDCLEEAQRLSDRAKRWRERY